MRLIGDLQLNKTHLFDVREGLRHLPDESVHCVMTSPPYYNLRSYKTQPQIWGGDEKCDHDWQPLGTTKKRWTNLYNTATSAKQLTSVGTLDTVIKHGALCGKCGASLCELGQEPTVELFVEHLVEVFREVKRVLRKDGTVFLNIADSYAGSGSPCGDFRDGKGGDDYLRKYERSGEGIKSKDLCGVPESLILALRKDGWSWRQTLVWAKGISYCPSYSGSTMPDSCTDRFARAHEYIYLLAKNNESTFWTHRDHGGTRQKPKPDYRWLDKATEEELAEAPPEWETAEMDNVNGEEIVDSDGVVFKPDKIPRYRRFNLWEGHDYFFDLEAVKETADPGKWGANAGGGYVGRNLKDYATHGQQTPSAVKARILSNPHPTRTPRSVWAINPAHSVLAHYACVDEDTECLTIEGWKRYDQLCVGMIAAQYDVNTKLLSWAPLENIAIYNVSEETMIVAKNHSAEMVLTPNHRTIATLRNYKGNRQFKDLQVVRADELTSYHAIPISADWDYRGESPISPDWAELIGWYIAEGCQTMHSWSVEIYQSQNANPDKVIRIRNLLNLVGAEYTEAVFNREWRGSPSVSVAFQVRGFAAAFLRQWSPNKGFPSNVLGWSDELLSRLFCGLIDGDGSRRKDGRFFFVQRGKECTDITQAIGVRLGFATVVSWRSTGSYVIYFTKKRLLSFRGARGYGTKIGNKLYSGVIWCPQLPKGAWVARKGGRSFITGNSFPSALVEPCIKAGTSARGACLKCGAPYYRLLKDSHKAGVEGHGSRTADHVKTSSSSLRTKTWQQKTTIEWQPTCGCEPEAPVPAIILDPFMGSGTVGVVCRTLQPRRDFVGIDVKPEYVDIANKRVKDESPGVSLLEWGAR